MSITTMRQFPPETVGDIATLPTTVKNAETNLDYEVTCVGDCAFIDCFSITATGLAGQNSITSFEHCAYACCNIKDTGLGSNAKVKTIGLAALQRTPSLVISGLETNHLVTSIEKLAFYRDSNLGTLESPQANKGDLVLNEPDDGSALSLPSAPKVRQMWAPQHLQLDSHSASASQTHRAYRWWKIIR